MIITTTIWLTAETERSEDSEKIFVEIEHDLTREDLNEFVREQGFSDYKSYFSHYITDSDDLNEVLNDIEKNICIETDIKIYCDNLPELQNFIQRKYQNEILRALLKKIKTEDYSLDI